MLGWIRRASTCRSVRKRSIAYGSRGPERTSLTATSCRYWPSARSARYTVPMPPCPSALRRRHGPRQLPSSGSASAASVCRSTMNRSTASARSSPPAASIASSSSRNCRIPATRLRQELPPRFNGLSAGQLEELLDPLPVHGIHDCPSRPGGRLGCSVRLYPDVVGQPKGGHYV